MSIPTSNSIVLATDASPNVRPPGSPWCKLCPQQAAGAYLSYHYSDPLSPLPVRGVTKLHDNKADPNLETGTYGLFSTCSKQMRLGVVNHGRSHIVFVTRHGGERVITGYYRIGWYAPTGFAADDFCLAAARMHFVAKPLRMAEIGPALGLRYSRLILCLSPAQTAALVRELDRQPDATAAYLREIRRLEHFNFFLTNYRYVNFRRSHPFDWAEAAQVFAQAGAAARQNAGATANGSPTHWWHCRKCAGRFPSLSLLKICPGCGAFGSLDPIPKTP